MKKLFITSSIAFLANASIVFAAGLVPECEGISCTICDLVKLANNLIGWLTQASLAVAVLVVGIGGYFILTAGGSEEKVKRGRQIIWSAVIGVAIILAAWVLVNTFLQILMKSPSPWPWNKIPEDCRPLGVQP